ncbi:MAG: hypothetical protein ABH828_00205 [archaeon]
MKKLLLFATIFLLALVSVSATAQLTLIDVNLGSDAQNRDETASATLTVTNTGDENITGIVLTTNANSEYAVAFSANNFDLLVGASKDVIVSGFVPEDFDAGVTKIGTLTATGTATTTVTTVTGTSDLNMEAENNLVIRDLDISVNGDSESLDDGDDIAVFPASEIVVTIELKNTHSTINIEDIEVTIYNDDLDVDESDDISKIKDGDKEILEFKFTIDEDADEDVYEVEITVEGEDENGALHSETWTIDFDLEEKGIIITKAEMIPETLVCGADSFSLRLELTNVGDKDEDEAAIEIIANTLGFEKRVSNLVIDEKDEIIRTYEITVPENANPGVHLIEVTAFLDFDEQTHEKVLYFTVPSGCDDVVEEEETEDESDIIVIVPEEDDGLDFVDLGEGTTTVQDNKSEFDFDTGFWLTVLLVLVNILVVVLIVILIVRFLVRG